MAEETTTPSILDATEARTQSAANRKTLNEDYTRAVREDEAIMEKLNGAISTQVTAGKYEATFIITADECQFEDKNKSLTTKEEIRLAIRRILAEHHYKTSQWETVEENTYKLIINWSGQ